MSEDAGGPAGSWVTGWRRGGWRSPVAVVVAGVILGVIAGAIGGSIVLSRAAVYRSSTVLMIDQEPALAKSTDANLLTKLVRLRLKYAGIVSTEVFAAPVATSVGLPLAQVHDALSASAPDNSLLITVTAQTGSANQAREIAAGAATGLISYLREQQTAARISAGEQVQLSVVTPADQGQKASPSRKRALVVGLVAFVIVAVAGALAADALRRRAR